MLKQVTKDDKSWFLGGKAEQKGSDPTHALTVPNLFEPSCHPIEHIGDIETGRTLVLDAQLYRIEKFLHGVVKHTKIGPAPDHILINDFGLLVELVARVEVQGQEVLVLKLLGVRLVAVWGQEYRLASHSWARVLSWAHLSLYCIGEVVRGPYSAWWAGYLPCNWYRRGVSTDSSCPPRQSRTPWRLRSWGRRTWDTACTCGYDQICWIGAGVHEFEGVVADLALFGLVALVYEFLQEHPVWKKYNRSISLLLTWVMKKDAEEAWQACREWPDWIWFQIWVYSDIILYLAHEHLLRDCLPPHSRLTKLGRTLKTARDSVGISCQKFEGIEDRTHLQKEDQLCGKCKI